MVSRTAASQASVGQKEFRSVERTVSVAVVSVQALLPSSRFPTPIGGTHSVPVASVLRQLRSVASQSVACASPRAVLSDTLHTTRRAAASRLSSRIVERLADTGF